MKACIQNPFTHDFLIMHVLQESAGLESFLCHYA